jgi:DNA-binding response OmpR family regulator
MTTVLVADDDADIRDLVTFKLEQAGHRVVAVADGVQALEAVRDHLPDLAVLDLMMPGLSGLDVCAEIRRDPRSAHLPVIMLTARVQEQDVALGFATGADDYVTKPFSPRELLSRVQAVLARTTTAGATSPATS